MKMRHLIIYALFFVMLSAGLEAQNLSSGQSFGSRFYLGGNLGLSFGNITSIYVAPVGIYAITEKLHAGLGITYQYVSNRNYVPKVDASIYGGSIFARYFVTDALFAHAEYEKLYYRDSYSSQGNYPISTTDGFYVGGGYRSWVGQNAFVTVLVLFDLTKDYYEFGTNPFLRFGMGFGI